MHHIEQIQTKERDITALGEILIDYTPLPDSDAGMAVFEQNPGGAPANVLVCAARLGRSTAFIGKVGDDMQGRFLRATLEKMSIDTRGLRVDERYFTTLAFVRLTKQGERSFSFARKPGADTSPTSLPAAPPGRPSRRPGGPGPSWPMTPTTALCSGSTRRRPGPR